MGLDTTHNAWHGAYSTFTLWRQKIASIAGMPPLNLMEGFFERDSVYDPFRDIAKQFPAIANIYYDALPIKWESLKPDPLHNLLNHSDCDGEIPAEQCGPIADRLEQLLPMLPDADNDVHVGMWRDKTQQFIDGLRAAAAANEPLEFN